MNIHRCDFKILGKTSVVDGHTDGRTHGRTDGWTDVKTVYTPHTQTKFAGREGGGGEYKKKEFTYYL